MELTPLLKWAGSKTWLAPKLKELYEPYRLNHTWVEPFCGALGATLGVMPYKALLTDSNKHLINLYRYIDSGQSNNLADRWDNTEETYYSVRAFFNRFHLGDPMEVLAFYWLNRHCYRGLCRFNQKGEFNVPYGNYKKPKVDHDFGLYHQAFKHWDFFCLDWEEAVYGIPSQSFVYADPPYDDSYVGYQKNGFDWDDQVQLAIRLGKLKCPVVISNKATERILDLYEVNGFNTEIIEVPRRISCDGNRKPVLEMLATKNV